MRSSGNALASAFACGLVSSPRNRLQSAESFRLASVVTKSL